MQITIVGGGFGGVRAALKLSEDKANEITLISDRSTFQYYPTLYSSATGHSHLESWAPLGEIFAGRDNIRVYIDTIEQLDATKKTITGSSGAVYSYSTLILAMGVVTTYFGIPGLETYSYGIKSEQEITHLKHRLFVDIAEKRRLDRNYIVIGAGPTGVELSAALGTYIKRLCKHYKVKHHKLNIRLIEAAPRVLPRSSELTSRIVEQRLKRLGVKVETNKKVESQNATSLMVSGAPIASHTVIWTSGVSNHPFFAAHPDVFTLGRGGRVEVNEYMQAHDNIYVIGDNALTDYTGLAQTAIHDADFVAKNLKRYARGKRLYRYKAKLPASVVPVGAHWAAFEWRSLRIYGWVGALIRSAADIIGYSDIMPIGTSLGAWRASRVHEDDYFTPTVTDKKVR